MKFLYILHLGHGEKLRNRYFVSYDVSDQQRLALTYKKMQGYGEHIQYSVFACDLNNSEIIMMKEDLGNILNLTEDRVLIINTGSTEKSSERVSTMGMSLETQKDATIVI